MKQLFFLLILVAGISPQINAQTGKKKGSASVNWSQQDQQNSTLFKSLKGQDRITVFKQLQSLIRLKSVAADGISKTTNWAQVNNESTLIALLGQPDVQIQKTLIEYFLSADSSTKLVVGLDQNKLIVFYTIK
jgi:hypothetical protein